ncbi:MAG: molybdenum cofactor biosynthesis protein MoaE [Verrucomicrobiota bacterium]
MAKNWPIESVRLVHRVGIVKVNEPSLWVVIVASTSGRSICRMLVVD